MQKTLMIVDGFFPNPLKVREFVLSKKFVRPTRNISGQWQGREYLPDQKEAQITLGRIIKIMGIRDIQPSNFQGLFRVVTKSDFEKQLTISRALIHYDDFDWSAMIMLSLPKHCQGYLKFYQHKKSGLVSYPADDNEHLHQMVSASTNTNEWIELMSVKLMFNRLIIFKPRMMHGLSVGFGTRLRNAKLFQHFAFNKL